MSSKGEAPPCQALRHINSVENLLTETTYSRKFDRTYTELAIDRGHDTVRPPSKGGGGRLERVDYDWNEVDETLRGVITERVFSRARDEYVPRGEIPPNRYINNHDDLPTASAIHKNYCPKDKWKEELGLEEERDVNVDPSDFEL